MITSKADAEKTKQTHRRQKYLHAGRAGAGERESGLRDQASRVWRQPAQHRDQRGRRGQPALFDYR